MKLSIITETEGKTRVAHVGASLGDNAENDIWSDNDQHHDESVYTWLNKFGFGDMMMNRDDDFIDLHDKRDFLHESHKYDIVILHMVYNPHASWKNRYEDHGSPYRISRSHNRENWVHRLVETEAHYIFTFGSGDEVDGEFLKNIPGYDGPIDAGNYMQVYMRLW